MAWLWSCSAARCAASVAAGVSLGLLSFRTPVWVFWCAAVLIVRTHLPSVAVGWLLGWGVSYATQALNEPVGAWVLRQHEPFWRAVLVRPGICYLRLEEAWIMGNVVIACATFVVLLPLAIVAARAARRMKWFAGMADEY